MGRGERALGEGTYHQLVMHTLWQLYQRLARVTVWPGVCHCLARVTDSGGADMTRMARPEPLGRAPGWCLTACKGTSCGQESVQLRCRFRWSQLTNFNNLPRQCRQGEAVSKVAGMGNRETP